MSRRMRIALLFSSIRPFLSSPFSFTPAVDFQDKFYLIEFSSFLLLLVQVRCISSLFSPEKIKRVAFRSSSIRFRISCTFVTLNRSVPVPMEEIWRTEEERRRRTVRELNGWVNRRWSSASFANCVQANERLRVFTDGDRPRTARWFSTGFFSFLFLVQRPIFQFETRRFIACKNCYITVNDAVIDQWNGVAISLQIRAVARSVSTRDSRLKFIIYGLLKSDGRVNRFK